MTDPTTLVSQVEQRISGEEMELPVLDEVALRVYREARSGELDAQGLCDLLKGDPVLVSEVLKLANSAIFGGLVEVRNLRHAVVRLGTRQLAALALSAGCKRLYGDCGERYRSRLRRLWRHTSAVASGSRWLALRAGHRRLADEVFVAGLLHDIGKLLVLSALDDLGERDGIEPSEDEIETVIDALGRERGAWLLERWQLPDVFAELVRDFDEERCDEADVTRCLVRIADRTCTLEGLGDGSDPDVEPELESLPECRALELSREDLDELIDQLRHERGG